MLRSKRMKLFVFVVSSTLNALAIIGVTIAICEPVPLWKEIMDEGKVLNA